MMRDTGCPECRWTTVTDESGRRRLEMRWQLPIAAPARTSVLRAA
ncbi:hypothetical protein [Geodermatophilus sabuli]|nr:hypothetical protein [Geodermatophilus sabuli]